MSLLYPQLRTVDDTIASPLLDGQRSCRCCLGFALRRKARHPHRATLADTAPLADQRHRAEQIRLHVKPVKPVQVPTGIDANKVVRHAASLAETAQGVTIHLHADASSVGIAYCIRLGRPAAFSCHQQPQEDA